MLLHDGSQVALRALRPQERAAVLDVFGRLSEQSRRQRFLGAKPQLSERELDLLTDVDDRRHIAVLALDDEKRPVGLARLVRDGDDPAEAEIAFAVVDEWQGRGVGTVLAYAIAGRARQIGVERLRALVLSGNTAMLELVKRIGRVRDKSFDGGSVELVVEL